MAAPGRRNTMYTRLARLGKGGVGKGFCTTPSKTARAQWPAIQALVALEAGGVSVRPEASRRQARRLRSGRGGVALSDKGQATDSLADQVDLLGRPWKKKASPDDIKANNRTRKEPRGKDHKRKQERALTMTGTGKAEPP